MPVSYYYEILCVLRRCLSGMFGGTVHYDSSSCSYQLQEYNRIEEEADRRTSRWKRIWDRLEPPRIKKKVYIHAKFCNVAPRNSGHFSSCLRVCSV